MGQVGGSKVAFFILGLFAHFNLQGVVREAHVLKRHRRLQAAAPSPEQQTTSPFFRPLTHQIDPRSKQRIYDAYILNLHRPLHYSDEWRPLCPCDGIRLLHYRGYSWMLFS